MEHLDLNINNYKLEDLLRLFHLTYDFTTEDLKLAKKIVLKFHPDKSRLDPKFYQFYKKAYDIVEDIYNFKNKLTKNTENVAESYEVLLDDPKEKNKLLDNFFTTNGHLKRSGDFNNWFNKEFDKQYINENDKGYNDWLKSDDDFINMEGKTFKNCESELEQKKKKLQEIIVYKGIQELTVPTSYGSSLGQDDDNFSSSDIFSKFKYQDLKQAYQETIIPITQDDYNNVKKYSSVNEYKQIRSMPIPVSSEFESRQILQNKEKQFEEQATKNAFYYSKQMEEYQKRNNEFMSNLQRLKY
jgi:hypothetical protein